jgi:hypothetical protein
VVTPAKRPLRSLLLPALLAAAALSLGTCKVVTGILSWSMFPSFLSGVEATRNLTQELDDLLPAGTTDWGSRIAVLRSPLYGDVDYVFLLVNTPRGNRLIVLDRNLDIVNTIDDGNFGERMMVGAQGNFVVGKVVLVGAQDSAPTELSTSDPDTNKPGVTGDHRNCLIYAGGNTLYVESYDPQYTWNTSTLYSDAIASDGGNWNVAGVGYDSSRTDEEVMLGLVRWDTGTLAVLFVHDADLATGGLSPPLEETYVSLGQGFARQLSDVRRVHYTRNGIVVRSEQDDGQCYLLDYDGGELHRFQLNVRGGLEEAYDIEGEHFYYFVRDERVLFKGRTGW